MSAGSIAGSVHSAASGDYQPCAWVGGTFSALTPAGAHGGEAFAADGALQAGGAWSENPVHAGYWMGSAGSWVDLNPPGASSSVIFAMNGNQFAGRVDYPATSGHAGIWSSGGAVFTDVHPTGASGSQIAATTGVLQAGAAGFGSTHAALWAGTAASFIDLHPAGASESGVNAASGEIQAGAAVFGGLKHAAIWRGTVSSFRDLNPPGAVRSQLLGAAGPYQVGYTFTGVVNRAALWSGTPESCVDLSAALPPGYGSSDAQAVHFDGITVRIVGSAQNIARGGTDAILWTGLATSLCYSNCDASSLAPILNIADFICFLNKYVAGDTYGNCDGSTLAPTQCRGLYLLHEQVRRGVSVVTTKGGWLSPWLFPQSPSPSS